MTRPCARFSYMRASSKARPAMASPCSGAATARPAGLTGRRTSRRGSAPAWENPLVVQVSRWDPLKDPIGVMEGFAQLLDANRAGKAHLVLAGPNVADISDDPEVKPRSRR